MLPVGVPLVYDGSEGGCASDLANQIVNTSKVNMKLSDEGLQMTGGKYQKLIE